MAKYGCRHCGGENEVPLSAEAKIEQVGAEIKSGLQELLKRHSDPKPVDLSAVLTKLDEIKAPPIIHTSCEEHPELCQHKHALDDTQGALAEAKKALENWTTGNVHMKLSEEWLESQEDCPDCKAALASYVEKKAKAKVEPPKAEVKQEPVTVPADDEAPWSKWE